MPNERPLWPEEPLNAGPLIRVGTSIITVRLEPEIARWLAAKYPADPILSAAVAHVLRKAMEGDTGGAEQS